MLRANTKRAPAESTNVARARRRALRAVIPGLAIVAMLVAACGATTTTPGANTTPTTTPGSTVKVYLAKHPNTDNNPTAVFALTRTTTAATVQERATFALNEMLKGPTTAERAQNYYSPFDGQLALQSVCAGEFRSFDLTLDHRGTKAESGTATLQFCRRVDIPPGDLDGPRMSAMITSTLLQFSQIKQVVILSYKGDCFDDLQGQNACLKGQQTGYPVQVFFSKQGAPPSELFAVNRTSPTLGVATYAISQLITGPTAAEKAQGLFTPLEGTLSGTSTCSGADFKITLNWSRTHAADNVATVQFCRDVPGYGDSPSAMVRNEITRTLMQFSNIHEVVIIYKDGSCFDDLSGQCG